MSRALTKALEPIYRRMRLLAGRAVIRIVRDSLKEQGVQVQLLADEVGDAERYQHYGFTSHPHPGGEAIHLSINGSREHLVVIADGDRRYRLKGLAQGEVALYTDEGDNVILKRGKIVEVNTDTMRINAATLCQIDAPTVQINAGTACNIASPTTAATGNITAGGDITDQGASGVSMGDMRGTYNSHTHNDPQGGTTGAPNQTM